MRVQKIYENALAILGKTEEGTAYPFMQRVPFLVNQELVTLNLFRDDENQLPEVNTVADEINITSKEAQGLSLCLACVMATEIDDVPEERVADIVRNRNSVMGSITSGMEEIRETIGVS